MNAPDFAPHFKAKAFDDKTQAAFDEMFSEAFATKFGQLVDAARLDHKPHICPICADAVISHDDDFCAVCNSKGEWKGNVFIDENDKAWRF